MSELRAAFERFTHTRAERAAINLVRTIMAAPDGREFLLAQRHDPGLRRQVLRLARLDVRLAIQAGGDWTERAVRWMVDLRAGWPESAEFFSKLSRRAHYLDNTATPYLRPAEVLAGELTTVDGRARLHLYLSSLRAELRCGRMEEAIGSLLAENTALDPYTHALYAFALIVQNRAKAIAELDAVLAEAGDDPSVLHALTEALRNGNHHPERMLDLLGRKTVASRPDATILHRQAIALRRLGRYEEALEAVDGSLARLGPNEKERWAARMSERHRILEERQLTVRIREEFAAAQEAALVHLEQTSHDTMATLRGQATDNLFRIVEILGVFTAVIALVVGGVASVGMAGIQWWQRAVLLLVFGLVSIAFFVCLRFTVRHQPRSRT